MPDDFNVLCSICARGGSKGIPSKNVKEVGGKPLIAHTVEDALAWDRCDDLVVSTDSDEIAGVAEEYGARVPFRRPPELASDRAAKLPAIQHAHREMERVTGAEYDYIVDLDATAPLRTVQDIENCFQVVNGTEAHNAYTVTEAHKNPYFNMVELDEDGYASLSKEPAEKVVRRQDAPEVYDINASIYIYERSYLVDATTHHGERTRISEMPPERSIDIDEPIDLAFVEFMFERGEEYL